MSFNSAAKTGSSLRVEGGDGEASFQNLALRTEVLYLHPSVWVFIAPDGLILLWWLLNPT